MNFPEINGEYSAKVDPVAARHVGEAIAPASSRQVGGTHYKDMPIQPLEVMRMVLTPEEYVGYLKGCILKYGMRAGHKANTDDAGKARHYEQFLREYEAQRLAEYVK